MVLSLSYARQFLLVSRPADWCLRPQTHGRIDLGTGKAGCYQEGFSATGYADAQAQFTSGKAAVYNIGTWELGNLATDSLDAGVRDAVDYFTLPTIEGAATSDEEYVTPSGIGMAVNAQTYDPLVQIGRAHV